MLLKMHLPNNAMTDACENGEQAFEFNKDVRFSMCDKCIVTISNREGIELLPDRYKCDICKQKS